MKKSILTIGKSLSKVEQKIINGGKLRCSNANDCPEGMCCTGVDCIFLWHPLCQ